MSSRTTFAPRFSVLTYIETQCIRASMIRNALDASSAERFDFGRAIAKWRRAMVAGGISSRETLDELESHLRDDMEEKEHGD